MHPIQRLVVDDHTLFRRGLIALLSQDGRYAIAG
jgi:two-component system nitrate/nitrite response regulator NarL